MDKALRHEMIPLHEVLPEKEAEALLIDFKISRAQLPIIHASDPALKGFDVRVGDIIKITRENPVTGTSFTYRVVTIL